MILPDRIFPRSRKKKADAEAVGTTELPDDASTAPGVDIRHAILTRFNFRMLRRHRELDQQANLDRWLRHRIGEWQRICLPSVVGQERRPTRWLLGLDGLARDSVAEVLTAIEPHRWIRPAWQDEGDSPTRAFSRGLNGLVEPERWVATTRLDNDDALALDYLAQVHKYGRRVIEQQPELDDFWVAFGLGAQLVKGNVHLLPYSDPPFLTRFRRGGKPTETVNAIKHTELYERPEPVFVAWTRTPMWLQNIHEENLVNSAKDVLRLSPTRDALALFGLQGGTPSWRDLVPERVKSLRRSDH